eukprot:6018693-Alexandrium_andersonii.AAC.1
MKSALWEPSDVSLATSPRPGKRVRLCHLRLGLGSSCANIASWEGKARRPVPPTPSEGRKGSFDTVAEGDG